MKIVNFHLILIGYSGGEQDSGSGTLLNISERVKLVVSLIFVRKIHRLFKPYLLYLI
jgi:hypothetical protein